MIARVDLRLFEHRLHWYRYRQDTRGMNMALHSSTRVILLYDPDAAFCAPTSTGPFSGRARVPPGGSHGPL